MGIYGGSAYCGPGSGSASVHKEAVFLSGRGYRNYLKKKI